MRDDLLFHFLVSVMWPRCSAPLSATPSRAWSWPGSPSSTRSWRSSTTRSWSPTAKWSTTTRGERRPARSACLSRFYIFRNYKSQTRCSGFPAWRRRTWRAPASPWGTSRPCCSACSGPSPSSSDTAWRATCWPWRYHGSSLASFNETMHSMADVPLPPGEQHRGHREFTPLL